MGSKFIIKMDGQKTTIENSRLSAIGVEGDLGRSKTKEFTYDHSYWTTEKNSERYDSQQTVFNDLGMGVVNSAYEGYNACIFAYGQTGSGKTYTMMGEKGDEGIIPRVCEGLYTRMKETEGQQTTYRVEVCYLEIYNERVRDLLGKGQQHSLRVREHPKDGPYVQDLSKHVVKSFAEISELMSRGNNQRTTASTNMNDVSSRSHALFTLRFTQARFEAGMPSETTSKLHLVDLAGSERADATGATGQRLKEGGSINKSLVTLGNVISVLAENSSKSRRKKPVFIPYRDSVLTWLLKDSLGGNSKTVMLATISPADCNYAETLSTLRYANRAKKIINKPTINEDDNVRLIRELKAEIERLRALLGSNLDVEQTPLVQGRLHESEARVKVLTDEWTGKWKEIHNYLQEQKTSLRKEGLAVVIDSELPHLIGIDDDIMSTGIVLFHLQEGLTRIGQQDSEPKPDIVLRGEDIEPDHCSIEYKPKESVRLIPTTPQCMCLVNGIPVSEPTELNQGSVILLGHSHMFRFNNPAEIGRLRSGEKLKNGSGSRISLISNQRSMERMSGSEDSSSEVKQLRDALARQEEEMGTRELEREKHIENLEKLLEQKQQDVDRLTAERNSIEVADQPDVLAAEHAHKSRELQLVQDALNAEKAEQEQALSRRAEELHRWYTEQLEALEAQKTNRQQQREQLLQHIADEQKYLTERESALQQDQSHMMTSLNHELLELRSSWHETKEKLVTAKEHLQQQLQQTRDCESRNLAAVSELQRKLDLAPPETEEEARLISEAVDELQERETSIRLERREKEREMLLALEDGETELRADSENLQLAKAALAENESDLQVMLSRGDPEAEVFHQKLVEARAAVQSEEVRLNQQRSDMQQLRDAMKQLASREAIDLAEVNCLREQLLLQFPTSRVALTAEKQRLLTEISYAKRDAQEYRHSVENLSRACDKAEEKVRNAEHRMSTAANEQQIKLGEIQTRTAQLQSQRCEVEREQETGEYLNEWKLERQRLHEHFKEQQESIGKERDVFLELHQKREASLAAEWERFHVSLKDLDKCRDSLNQQSSDVAERQRKLEAATEALAEARAQLDNERSAAEHKRSAELDQLDREKFRLNQMEHDQRINNLVEEEVSKRLIDERRAREEQLRAERSQRERERAKEVAALRQIHERELYRLRQQMDDRRSRDSLSPTHSRAELRRKYNATVNATVERGVHSYVEAIHISLPSHELRGYGRDEHIDFEVKVSVCGETWTVMRRYSKFLELHNYMRNKYPKLNNIVFPRKKLFGAREESFLIERRTHLERYLQQFMRVCVANPSCPLHPDNCSHLSKAAVCDFAPFFRRGIFEATKHGI